MALAMLDILKSFVIARPRLEIDRGMRPLLDISLAAKGGNLAKIPPNQVIDDFGRGSSVESESE